MLDVARYVLVCAAVGVLAACGHHSQSAAEPTPAQGAALYAQHCAACHGSAEKAAVIGPSLHGERARKDRDAVIRIIEHPSPPMPKLYPQPLSKVDVAAIAAYVETL